MDRRRHGRPSSDAGPSPMAALSDSDARCCRYRIGRLVRPGAPTHAFDMEQRMIQLSFTAGTGVLNATAPPNGNIAPPGYYMLFILNSAGVPSVASFVRSGRTYQTPPRLVTSPASNVTVNPGASAVLRQRERSRRDHCLLRLDLPRWRPASSSVANAGNITYSVPGTIRCVVQGDRQRRVDESVGDAHRDGARDFSFTAFLPRKPSRRVAARPMRRRSPGGPGSRVRSISASPACRRVRPRHSARVRFDRIGFEHAQRDDERNDAGRVYHAGHDRDQRAGHTFPPRHARGQFPR